MGSAEREFSVLAPVHFGSNLGDFEVAHGSLESLFNVQIEIEFRISVGALSL